MSLFEANKDATGVLKGVMLDWRPKYVVGFQSHGHYGPREEDSYGSWHDENKMEEIGENRSATAKCRSDLYENSIIKQDGSYSYRLAHPKDWIYDMKQAVSSSSGPAEARKNPHNPTDRIPAKSVVFTGSPVRTAIFSLQLQHMEAENALSEHNRSSRCFVLDSLTSLGG